MPVEFSGTGCVALAVLCLILPLDWVLSAVLAAAVHEGGHLLGVFLADGKIRRMKIGFAGAELESTPLTPGWELLAILAGPVASFSVLFLRSWLPKAAICGLAQGCFNLLPFYPLDGGRALECICGMVFSARTGAFVCTAVRFVTYGCLIFLGFWSAFSWKMGMAPLFLVILLLAKAAVIKKSCKEGNLRVQ